MRSNFSAFTTLIMCPRGIKNTRGKTNNFVASIWIYNAVLCITLFKSCFYRLSSSKKTILMFTSVYDMSLLDVASKQTAKSDVTLDKLLRECWAFDTVVSFRSTRRQSVLCFYFKPETNAISMWFCKRSQNVFGYLKTTNLTGKIGALQLFRRFLDHWEKGKLFLEILLAVFNFRLFDIFTRLIPILS